MSRSIKGLALIMKAKWKIEKLRIIVSCLISTFAFGNFAFQDNRGLKYITSPFWANFQRILSYKV